MLVVHGLWSPGRGSLLWAEDSDRPTASPSAALRSARPHPFALPADRLAAIHPGRPAVATLLLPSGRRGPLDSPELVRAVSRRPARTAASLVGWSVPVVVVDPGELADLADEVRYGASVRYLRAVMEFAEDLAARGRVLPGLRTGGPGAGSAGAPEEFGWADAEAVAGGPRAVWRPVLTGPDAQVRRELVAAAPPVTRAEQSGPPGMAVLTGPAGRDPAELLDDALDDLVDVAVRDRLGRAAVPVRLGPPGRGGAAARAWLAALTSADGAFETPSGELGTLSGVLAPWARVVDEASGPARATFRLTEVKPLDDPAEPDVSGPDTVWRLDFLLRSAEDPSLLVGAEQIWQAPEAMSRWITQPGEVLLAELGRASVIYPELAESLRGARPVALVLDLEGAYRFLSEVAARLDQAGFGVLLPSWWGSTGRPERGVGLAVSAGGTPVEGIVVAGGLSRTQLARFDWRLAVGEVELTEAEIGELVAAKAPLVRLRGHWVRVDPDRLRRGLEFLRRAPTEASTAADVLAVMNGLDSGGLAGDPLPLPVTSVRADGWVGELLAGTADRSLAPVDPPPGFLATLRPYQRRGLSWLVFLSSLGLGACLADDMGLGKTVQLLALEATEREGGPGAAARAVVSPDPPAGGLTESATHPDGIPHRRQADSRGDGGVTLLVCPMSLVGNWQREAAGFAPMLRVYAHHGPGRPRGMALDERLAGADLMVTTYGTLTRDVEQLAGRRWRRVVLDEAQMVKNSRSAAAQAVRRLDAEHRVALTGTPMENRLSELWSVMDFLNPGVLGTGERFRQRFAVPVERHGDADAARRLRTLTRPYLLRRLKTDPDIAGDLPEKIEIIQDYRLTPEQASLYRTVVDDMLDRIAGADAIQRRGRVLAAMAKLKQVCNHPAVLLHDGSPVGTRSGKVARLEEVLAELLAEGDRALMFTQFTEFGDLLVPHLSARFDTEVLYLHGGTPKQRRDEMVARFQSGDGPALFLLSLRAGGTGLTLTAANHVLHLDRWWNPAVENQATDRAFRIGQRQSVQVRKFVCAGTLEERIDRMIESKKELADLVISDGESWLTELSTGELRELLTLDEDAVGE